ncbi:MAG: class I SAM-dependent methyltransferase [Acidimicrobiales bacterium]
MPEAWTGARQASARFAAQAVAYDRYRPRYPAAVFDLIVEESGADPGDAVVEIGAGTGIATVPLVERGLEVTAVEPAHELAELTASKLGSRAQIIVDRFEECKLPDRARVLAAFNAWHWVEPRNGLDRAAQLLEGGGWVVLVWTEVIAWGSPRFEERLADLFDGPWAKRWDGVAGSLEPVVEDDRFGEMCTFHHPFARTLAADAYVAVCRTYGGQRSDEQYDALERTITEEFGGSVTKVEDAVVYMAPRR